MNGTDALKRFEEEYLEKILGFCYQKVDTRENAEDLSSEIALEVIKAIRSGKEIENLGAFVWSVSNHTFLKWLRAKKYGTTAYLDEMFVSPNNTEEMYIRRETENLLHQEIALLSQKYREAVVLYYFEGKSCSEIGEILGKSDGTVKWWLHYARNSIKKGIETMREYGEKSYNPGILTLSCQGNPGVDKEPMSCAKRKLAQNVLLAAYKEPMTMEQLCMELGTPAAYIEDEVENLATNQLMKKLPGGKYQTDFVILASGSDTVHKVYQSCFPDYYNALMKFLEGNRALLTSEKYNTAGFAWDRLLWVYIHIFTELCVDRFRIEEAGFVGGQDAPLRPNGGNWIALGFDGSVPDDWQEQQAKWKEYIPFDGPVHKPNAAFAQGYFHYWSGTDSSVFFQVPDDVFALCRDIIQGKLTIQDLNDEQKYLFSIALENKLFVREGDAFRLNYYFISREERQQLHRLAEAFYPTALEFLRRAYGIILGDHEASIPKHLHWQMGNFLSNYLGIFVTGSLYEGMKNHVLSAPDDNNREWLSLFASELY